MNRTKMIYENNENEEMQDFLDNYISRREGHIIDCLLKIEELYDNQIHEYYRVPGYLEKLKREVEYDGILLSKDKKQLIKDIDFLINDAEEYPGY